MTCPLALFLLFALALAILAGLVGVALGVLATGPIRDVANEGDRDD